MWIFCCGMQRSGSTLQFQITAKMVEDAGLGQRMEWTRARRFRKLRKEHINDPNWKVLKSHAFSEKMEKEFRRGNAKGVYCYRDLRDAFVSSMRKHELTFEQMWEAQFLETCIRQYEKWTAMPRVLISKYEQMMADLPGEIKRIAEHLGIDLSAEKMQQLADEYSLDRQKKRIEKAKEEGKLQHSYGNAYVDPHTGLHGNHIHSGETGGWKGMLTNEQVQRIEVLTGQWLIDHGYMLTTL